MKREQKGSNQMTLAYPLQWPSGLKRSRWQNLGRFNTSFADARDGILHELRLLGAGSVVISSNVELRQDGLPYAKQRDPADTGVAVYFYWKGKQYCMACDRWRKIKDNMQAIRKTIEAIRGIERWGSGEMLSEAFAGFERLEAPKARNCWSVLELEPTRDMMKIRDAYRRLAKIKHPDLGGNEDDMRELNIAYDQALENARQAL